MVTRRQAVPPDFGRTDAVVPTYGRGFHRMKERLGPKQAEELRQEVLQDQLAARAKWGDQPVLEKKDRTAYKDYPKSKKSKRRKK